jgi:hypothetical protein
MRARPADGEPFAVDVGEEDGLIANAAGKRAAERNVGGAHPLR